MTRDPLARPSPARARQMLREADATADAAAQWRPAGWAVAVVSLTGAVTAALAVTGAWRLMLAAWALTLALGAVLWSRLARPSGPVGRSARAGTRPLAQGTGLRAAARRCHRCP